MHRRLGQGKRNQAPNDKLQDSQRLDCQKSINDFVKPETPKIALESVREEALEEAAKVCHAKSNRPYDLADTCAYAIRALQHAPASGETKVGPVTNVSGSLRFKPVDYPPEPARVAEGMAMESGWLIERFMNERHEWFAGWNDDDHDFVSKSPQWTNDAFHAVRFARKLDADRIRNYSADFVAARVIDHGFLPSAPESTALTESDTPETDDFLHGPLDDVPNRRDWYTENDYKRLSEHARSLERRLVQSQARVAELEKVAKFLLGEEAFLGFWFGECPEGQPIFWWRKHLREALKSRP